MRASYHTSQSRHAVPVSEHKIGAVQRRPRPRRSTTRSTGSVVVGLWGGPLRATDVPGAPAKLPGYSRYCPYTRHPTATAYGQSRTSREARRPDRRLPHERRPWVKVWIARQSAGRGPLRGGAHAQPRLPHAPQAGRLRCLLRLCQGAWKPTAPSPGRTQHLAGRLPGARLTSSTCFSSLRRMRRRATTTPSSATRRIDARIQRALALQTSDPYRAEPALGANRPRDRRPGPRSCRSITHRQMEFVSKRVGNYQYNPHWGVLLDQLWVR